MWVRLSTRGGGSRLTNRLAIRAKELGMDLCVGWGMTEVYTKVGLQYLKPHMFSWSEDKKIDFLSRTGMAPPFVEQRVVDEQGRDVAKDRETVGEIVLRTEGTHDTVCGRWQDIKVVDTGKAHLCK
jgi:fatty-acyl-CoA synthase